MNDVFPTRIAIEGVRATGRHGANPGERDLPQEFVVDLEIILEISHDDLAETANYEEVVAITRRVVEEESYELIESLAYAVASGVFEIKAVLEVTAVVHKPAAAAALGVDDVSAEAVCPPETGEA